MSNETLAQGYELYFVDRISNPSSPALLKVGNITNLGEFGPTKPMLDSTNLDSKAREKLPGLADNGEMSLQVNLDMTSVAHRVLYAMSVSTADTRTDFIILASNGVAPPTPSSSGGIDPPGDRDWWSFVASVLSFRMPVAVDTIVNTTVNLSVSGAFTSSFDI